VSFSEFVMKLYLNEPGSLDYLVEKRYIAQTFK